MKKIKRIIACLCVCVLLVSAPTTSYARAYTYVNPTGAEEVLVIGGLVITTETALGWALSLLGFTAAANAIYENRDAWIGWCNDQADRIKEWFSDRAEDLSVTWGEFENWLGSIKDGALDTTSECWDTFLDYCTDLANQISASESDASDVDVNWSIVDGVQEFVDAHPSDFVGGIDYPVSHNYSVRLSALTKSVKSVSMSLDHYFTDDYITFVRTPYGGYEIFATSLNFDVSDIVGTGAFSSTDNSKLSTYVNYKEGVYPVFCTSEIWYGGMLDNTIINKWAPYVDRWLDLSSFTCSPQMWKSKGLYGLVSGIAIGWDGWSIEVPDVAPVEDVIVSPDTQGVIERDGNLDNVGVADVTGTIVGELTIPVDGITGLDVVSTPCVGVEGVYPVDIIGGVILGTDTPIDGIKPGVVPSVNGDYTIKGLQELFPFCIPFDLVSLFRTLSADAEAPCFKLPVPVPKKNWEFDYIWIELDFSKFNSAAKIFRTMELLGFCVGLTLITRNLIRG